MFKKTILGAALAASALVGLLPTAADAQVSIVLQNGPPQPVYEVVPAARPGYVWAPGHHQWRNNQYVWTTGQWYRERPGYNFQGAQWVQRNGRWVMTGNDWQRRGPNGDRDGDGVPNRRDRAPNNPNRY